MCSGSEAGSYLRLIDFVHHWTMSLRVISKKKVSEPGGGPPKYSPSPMLDRTKIEYKFKSEDKTCFADLANIDENKDTIHIIEVKTASSPALSLP